MVNNTARGSSTSLRKDMVPASETDRRRIVGIAASKL